MVRRKSSSPRKNHRYNREQCQVGQKLFSVSKKVLREVTRMQRTTDFCIPKLPFSRLVQELVQDRCNRSGLRVQALAMKALQDAVEMYAADLMSDANACANHAGRITLQSKDIRMARSLRKTMDW